MRPMSIGDAAVSISLLSLTISATAACHQQYDY